MLSLRSILATALCISLCLSHRRIAAVWAHCATDPAALRFQKCTALPTQQASIAWTFHASNATLDLAFFGSFISPSGWVALGLNPAAPEMTGTRALIAFSDPDSGSLLLLPFILDPSVKLQRAPLLSRPLDTLRLLSSSAALYGGRLATMRAGAQLRIFATLRLAPNRTRLHFVWNRGLYVQGYSPTIHPTTPADLSSAVTVDVLSGTSTAGRTRDVRSLRAAHAFINAFAWGVTLPIGAVAARYLRQVAAVGATWFYAHAAVQLAAFFLGTAGFAMGVRLGEMSPGETYGLHRRLGFTVFSLGSLQTAALLFRPQSTNRYRKYWKSYHHFVGYGCVVLGVVNCFQGFGVMGETRSYFMLAYCLCLSTILGVCVALEVNGWVIFCRKAKEEKLRREGTIGAVTVKESRPRGEK